MLSCSQACQRPDCTNIRLSLLVYLIPACDKLEACSAYQQAFTVQWPAVIVYWRAPRCVLQMYSGRHECACIPCSNSWHCAISLIQHSHVWSTACWTMLAMSATGRCECVVCNMHFSTVGLSNSVGATSAGLYADAEGRINPSVYLSLYKSEP